MFVEQKPCNFAGLFYLNSLLVLSMRTTFILLLLLSSFALSCAKKEDDQTGIPHSGYSVITVTNGGSVSGKITMSGERPTLSPIETQRDQGVCGASHPNPAYPGSGTGIAGCVVYIEHITQGKALSTAHATLDQKECAFLPYVQAANVNATLTVSNSDDALHNFHITKGDKTIVNEAQPEGAPPREVQLSTPGVLTISCDVHPWMKGYIFVAENPYYAITDSSGSFTLPELPPGDYSIALWRDNWNLEQVKDNDGKISSYKWGPDFVKKQQIHIEAGKTAEVNFSLP